MGNETSAALDRVWSGSVDVPRRPLVQVVMLIFGGSIMAASLVVMPACDRHDHEHDHPGREQSSRRV